MLSGYVQITGVYLASHWNNQRVLSPCGMFFAHLGHLKVESFCLSQVLRRRSPPSLPPPSSRSMVCFLGSRSRSPLSSTLHTSYTTRTVHEDSFWCLVSVEKHGESWKNLPSRSKQHKNTDPNCVVHSPVSLLSVKYQKHAATSAI